MPGRRPDGEVQPVKLGREGGDGDATLSDGDVVNTWEVGAEQRGARARGGEQLRVRQSQERRSRPTSRVPHLDRAATHLRLSSERQELVRRVDVDRIHARHDVLAAAEADAALATVGVRGALERERLHEPTSLKVHPPDLVALAADECVAGGEVVGERAAVAGHSHAVVRRRLCVELK